MSFALEKFTRRKKRGRNNRVGTIAPESRWDPKWAIGGLGPFSVFHFCPEGHQLLFPT